MNDKTRDPFPNEWRTIANTPADKFVSPPVSDILELASCWDLPYPFEFLVRTQDPVTLKVTEKAYKNRERAKTYITKQQEAGLVVTFYDDDKIIQLDPKEPQTE